MSLIHVHKIKLFSTDGEILSKLAFDNGRGPYDVAVVSNDEVVFTRVNEADINILDIEDNNITIRDKIELKNCIDIRDIAVLGEKFVVVVYTENFEISVQLVDRDSIIYWSRSRDDNGTKLFNGLVRAFCYFEKSKFNVLVGAAMSNMLVKLDGETGKMLKTGNLFKTQHIGFVGIATIH